MILQRKVRIYYNVHAKKGLRVLRALQSRTTRCGARRRVELRTRIRTLPKQDLVCKIMILNENKMGHRAQSDLTRHKAGMRKKY